MASTPAPTPYNFPILKYLSKPVDILRAGYNATIEEAMAYIQSAIDAISKNDSSVNITFTEEYPRKDAEGEINHPIIVWEVVSRQPINTETRERPRQYFDSIDESEDHAGILYGQRFDNIVQFNIFARTSKEANDTIAWFEEFMHNWRGALTSLGLQNVVERGRLRDDILKNSYAETLQVRSTQWGFRTERLIKNIAKKIERIYLEIHHQVKYISEVVTKSADTKDELSNKFVKIIVDITGADETKYKTTDYSLIVHEEKPDDGTDPANGVSYVEWDVGGATPSEGAEYTVQYFYSDPYLEEIYENDPQSNE